MQFELKIEPTSKEVCWMCHLSSKCSGCCKACTHQCNARQVCVIGVDKQSDRIASWIEIMRSTPSYGAYKQNGRIENV